MILRRSTATVYVVGVADNPVKVGFAEDMGTRLAALQIGCPDVLLVHHEITVPVELARTVEASAHRALVQHHRHGEWFNVSALTAKEAVMAVARPIVAAHEARLLRASASCDDVLSTMEAEGTLHPWARHAVRFYAERADKSDRAALATIHRAVMIRAGQDASDVLRKTVGRRFSVPFVFKTTARIAVASRHLELALNALGQFYAESRTAALEKQLDQSREMVA